LSLISYIPILSLTMAGENAHTIHEDKEKELEREVEKKDEQLKEEKKLTKELKSKMRKEASQFRKQLATRTLKLMTSGFGLVAALAWNELIKEIVKVYIKPFFGESSGLISLLIYAVLITFLAVLVTYNLSKVADERS